MKRDTKINVVSILVGLVVVFLGSVALGNRRGFGLPAGGFELILGGMVLFYVGGLWGVRRSLREFGTPEWECGACGYDMRGLDSGVCPECGAEREEKG